MRMGELIDVRRCCNYLWVLDFNCFNYELSPPSFLLPSFSVLLLLLLSLHPPIPNTPTNTPSSRPPHAICHAVGHGHHQPRFGYPPDPRTPAQLSATSTGKKKKKKKVSLPQSSIKATTHPPRRRPEELRPSLNSPHFPIPLARGTLDRG